MSKKKKDPPKKPPVKKEKKGYSTPDAKAEPEVSRRIATSGGAPKASNVYESHKHVGKGTYHQRKGVGKATANVKATSKAKTVEGATSTSRKQKAASPGRKTYTDMAGFLNIQK